MAGFIAPLAGPLFMARYGVRSTFYVSSAVTVGIMAIGATVPETLTPENRKPFTLARSNPLGNVAVLLNNGKGLRGLSISTILWFAVNSIWSSQFLYRVGVLQWTPTNDSHFTSGFNLAGVGAQRAIVGHVSLFFLSSFSRCFRSVLPRFSCRYSRLSSGSAIAPALVSAR